MVRRYSWSYRRENPTEFPFVCDVCPTKRFKLDGDIQKHRRMSYRHVGRPVATTTIQQYIDRDIQTSSTYRRLCSGVVERIGNILKNNVSPKYRPAEVIKGGSAGKGTAIRGSSDLDLVFLLPSSYDTVEKLQRDRDDILSDIKRTLTLCGYRVVGRSTKALQIQVKCNESGTGHHHSIDVDLLPAPNFDSCSSAKLYNQMSQTAADQRKFFTPSLTKTQRDFIKTEPEQLKRLIRYVKDWKNNNIQDSPSSYAIELLIKHLWKQYGEPDTFTFDNALGCVMEALVSYKNLRVEFDEYYEQSRRQRHSAPYIIDPVNPYSNVMAGYNHWQEVADKAKKYLQRNLSNHLRTGFY